MVVETRVVTMTFQWPIEAEDSPRAKEADPVSQMLSSFDSIID